jgi:hypothetical protein
VLEYKNKQKTKIYKFYMFNKEDYIMLKPIEHQDIINKIISFINTWNEESSRKIYYIIRNIHTGEIYSIEQTTSDAQMSLRVIIDEKNLSYCDLRVDGIKIEIENVFMGESQPSWYQSVYS